jgi:hypothetical protein
MELMRFGIRDEKKTEKLIKLRKPKKPNRKKNRLNQLNFFKNQPIRFGFISKKPKKPNRKKKPEPNQFLS